MEKSLLDEGLYGEFSLTITTNRFHFSLNQEVLKCNRHEDILLAGQLLHLVQ